MTPDDLQAPLGGSPESAGPETEAPGTSTFDWESDENPYKQRFNTYRSEADRKATEFSEYQRNVSDLSSDDPSRRAAAAEALGVELVEDEPVEYDDPYDELRAELEGLKGTLSQREQQQAQQQMQAEVERRLDKLGLSDEPDESGWSEKDWVLARAVQQPGADGLPDVAGAHAELKKLEAAVERKWAQSKRAPRSIQPGSTATQQKNIVAMTDAERIDYAVQLAEERAQL